VTDQTERQVPGKQRYENLLHGTLHWYNGKHVSSGGTTPCDVTKYHDIISWHRLRGLYARIPGNVKLTVADWYLLFFHWFVGGSRIIYTCDKILPFNCKPAGIGRCIKINGCSRFDSLFDNDVLVV